MNNSMWQIPETRISLFEHDLHIWKSSLNVDNQRFQFLKSLLSKDELRRAERFYFDKDKKQFVVGRGILRVLLGTYLEVNPQKLEFQYNKYGKPFIQNRCRTNLHFNLSHSKDMLVLAFTKNANVGVDIEYLRSDFDVVRLARQFFSKREVNELLTTPTDLLKIAFLNCWTRKEAFIKAKGKGLSIPLNKFDVSLFPGKPAVLRYFFENPKEISQWFLHEVKNIGEGYISSVAVKDHPRCIKNWEYDGKLELIYMYSIKSYSSNSYIFN